ncbi:MAG: FapA family protein [Lachnospiraceae bacterium]|nr:FapA family protein [Lachnospiraceae bacterium]
MVNDGFDDIIPSDLGDIESLINEDVFSKVEKEQAVKAAAGPTKEELEKEREQELSRNEVRISDDDMEAFLFLTKPKSNKYTFDEITKMLDERGVKAGLNVSNIKAMIIKGIYDREIKIASAIKPVEGHDGYYEYSFDFDEVLNRKPKIREDGSVDYTSMNYLQSVSKGEVFATYHSAEAGTNGAYVTGKTMPARAVKELPPIKGKGFTFNEETKEYISDLDGKITMKNKFEMDIKDVLQIQGDVNQLTGKIDTDCDVEILGNVENGAIIKSAKSVTISGTIEAAQITAGGDVTLKHGIQGNNRAMIVAKGNVYADFIEHTIVKAIGDVHSNTILNSNIYTNGAVIIDGKRGSLVGGYVHARKGISAVNMGNNVEVKTILHVGMEDKDFEKNQQVKENDERIREILGEVLEGLKRIADAKGKRQLTTIDKRELKDLTLRKNELMEELKANQAEAEKVNAVITASRGAYIKVDGHIYKGVIIGIDQHRQVIKNNTTGMLYTSANGVIEGEVLTH